MSEIISSLSENKLEKRLTVKDYLLTGQSFDLLADKEWDMLCTHPIPDDLEKFYASKAYKPHQHNSRSMLDWLYNFIRNRNYKYKYNLIKSYHPKAQSILDYGTATGEFLNYMQQKHFSVSGIEPNKDARNIANKNLDNKVKVSLQEENEKYDIISLWHVLEHVVEVETLIVQLRQRLKPEGKMLIAVPNFKSYDARHYQNYWAAYDVPRHVWHFSPLSIEKLFAKHGLRVITQKPLYFDSFYVSLLSESYKYGKKRYFSGFLNGLKSNLKARKNGQYSSLVYIISR